MIAQRDVISLVGGGVAHISKELVHDDAVELKGTEMVFYASSYDLVLIKWISRFARG